MNLLKNFIVFVFISVNYAHAYVEPQDEPINSLHREAEKLEQVSKTVDQELFKRLFTKRRKEEMEAVIRLQHMDSYEKRYKMVMILFENIFKVIEANKARLEEINYEPSSSLFPKEIDIKDALSNVLENSALFGDIVLHLPDITHRILKTHLKWHQWVHWSLKFLSQSKHLLDKSTNTMVHLARQELNMEPREEGYVNPYWIKNEAQSNDSKKKHSKKKTKLKKQPKAMKIEL